MNRIVLSAVGLVALGGLLLISESTGSSPANAREEEQAGATPAHQPSLVKGALTSADTLRVLSSEGSSTAERSEGDHPSSNRSDEGEGRRTKSDGPSESVLRHLRNTGQPLEDWIRYRDAMAALVELRRDSDACAMLASVDSARSKVEHWATGEVLGRASRQPGGTATQEAMEQVRQLVRDLRVTLNVDPARGGASYRLRAEELEGAHAKLSTALPAAEAKLSLTESALRRLLGDPRSPHESYLPVRSSR